MENIDDEEQLKRALSKKKYPKEVIINIISSQLPQKEKLKYADIVIDNSGNTKKTKGQTRKKVHQLANCRNWIY